MAENSSKPTCADWWAACTRFCYSTSVYNLSPYTRIDDWLVPFFTPIFTLWTWIILTKHYITMIKNSVEMCQIFLISRILTLRPWQFNARGSKSLRRRKFLVKKGCEPSTFRASNDVTFTMDYLFNVTRWHWPIHLQNAIMKTNIYWLSLFM